MEKIMLDELGVNNVRFGILNQTRLDYLEYKKMYHVARHISYKPMKLKRLMSGKINDIVKFFNSKWYRDLCDLDPAELLDILDAQFDAWKNNEDEVNEFIRVHREKKESETA